MGLDMYLLRDGCEVGYWRKANHIHNWFVNNVQDGIDDCGIYRVSKEQLQELLDLCIKVKEIAKLVPCKVKNGYTFDESGNKIFHYEDDIIIANPNEVEDILPTCDGFFFGSTQYNEWYMDDIESTIDILIDVIQHTNFETECIEYYASW